MMNITFNPRAADVRAALLRKGTRIVVQLAKKIDYLTSLLVRKIVTEKLSGQVLHHRTGNLIQSIHEIPAQVQGNSIVGAVEGAGGTAFYGRVHEEGGRGWYDIYPVNKKALAFVGRGGMVSSLYSSQQMIKAGLRKLQGVRTSTQNAGKALLAQAGVVTVKHVHHPPLPKRPFMRPSLLEMEGLIHEELQRTLGEAAHS